MHCYNKSPTLHETRKNRQEDVSDVKRTATEALKDLKWNVTTYNFGNQGRFDSAFTQAQVFCSTKVNQA